MDDMENHTLHGNFSSNGQFQLQLQLNIVRLVLIVPVALFSAAANLCIVCLVCCVPSTRSVSNFFYASMAVAYFGLGTLNYIFAILMGFGSSRWALGPTLCIIWCIMDGSLGTVTLYHLLAIAINRLYAIVYPLRSAHPDSRKRKVAAVLFAIWLLSFGLWSVYYLVIRYQGILCGHAISRILVFPTVIILYVVPLFGVLSLNIVINVKVTATNVTLQSCQTQHEEKKRHHQNRKMAFILATSTIVFLSCWLPWITSWVAYDMLGQRTPQQYLPVLDGLYCINSTLQPIFLLSFPANFCNALKQLVC